MNNLLLRCLLMFAVLTLAGCQTPGVSEVSGKYAPGDEAQVTANMPGKEEES